MSWISPTFGGGDPVPQPPKKKARKESTTEKESCSLSTACSSSCNWAQQYKPRSVDELAVNPKKVKELESWLEQSILFKTGVKYLLLTGPSGCGKTTTLQLVCKHLGFKIMEWITPLDRPSDEFEFSSKTEFSKNAAKQFEEYLFRSSRYNSCLVLNPTKKLVLVKDFPNVFIYNPATFHDVLENFSNYCINPIVFVCSDESLCKKLFPVTIKTNAQIQTITFNPITDQRMFKILRSIITQESKNKSNSKALTDEALHSICAASQGDLRGAISKLYFCSINSSFEIADLKFKGKFKKPKPVDEKVPTDKDKRIDFFHGIGRVLYPKKTETEAGVKFIHSTSAIVDCFLCEPNSFIAQLHENYPTKLGNVYDLSEAAERLSKSDILMTRWQDKDLFYEYSLSVAVQGLMIANKVPQKAKFEAFKKSQTSRLEIDNKAIELEGKAIFSELQILNYERLIDILPYCRLLLPNMNSAQIDYARKTSNLKSI